MIGIDSEEGGGSIRDRPEKDEVYSLLGGEGEIASREKVNLYICQMKLIPVKT